MPVMIPKSLIDEIEKGKASLFLGAGASFEANFPDSNGLAKHLIGKAGEPHSSKLKDRDLSTVADYLYLEPGYGKTWVEDTIYEFIKENNRIVSYPPSKAHEIMTLIRWRAIFTTNYDNLIENSYSNPKRVQEPLPIYNPDNNIKRHERDTIRIIKLNGSADEMSRNSKHHLVITFADQQDARSINQAFYELLREEAINGPIIFIGFRFQHPGAQNAGTSPEFSLLKDLLRDMGSARWHYCISPIMPESI